MQVSQLAELDSHVVIGGNKSENFKISQDAEFFTILSSTLYRDKKRAVVREVICNAWDAHVISGKTDTPVKISLTDTELVITDFGPGIPDNKMTGIYCTYGGTTKVHDGDQNGGFGLGSKAPFAYNDHFTVTSCHNGKRSVYALSRGGKDTQGAPGIRRMVQTDTAQSGLTVTVPLHADGDNREFRRLIIDIVAKGGIKATLNGDELFTLDYTEARKQGFCLINKNTTRLQNSLSMDESDVYVLYGTVLYPLSTTDGNLTDLVNRVKHYCHPPLVLCAKPNSIGVTPSRESLSYTETTIEYLSAILKRFLKMAQNTAPAGFKRLIDVTLFGTGDLTKKEILKNILKICSYASFHLYENIQTAATIFHKRKTMITDITEITMTNALAIRQTRKTGYNGYSYFSAGEMNYISKLAIKRIAKHYPDLRGALKRYMKHTKYKMTRFSSRRSAKYTGDKDLNYLDDDLIKIFYEHEAKPFTRFINKAGFLNSLYFFEYNSLRGISNDRFKTRAAGNYAQLGGATTVSINKNVVIATSQLAASDKFNELDNANFKTDGSSSLFKSGFVYPAIVLPRNAPAATKALLKKGLTDLGFIVHEAEKAKPRPKRVPVVKERIYYDLAKCVRGRYLVSRKYTDKTLKNPKFYLPASFNSSGDLSATGDYFSTAPSTLNHHFSDIALANIPEAKHLEAQGVRNILEVIRKKLIALKPTRRVLFAYMVTSQKFVHQNAEHSSVPGMRALFDLVKASPVFAELVLNKSVGVTKECREAFKILSCISHFHLHASSVMEGEKGLSSRAIEHLRTFQEAAQLEFGIDLIDPDAPKYSKKSNHYWDFAYLDPIHSESLINMPEASAVKLLKFLIKNKSSFTDGATKGKTK